MVQNRLIDEGKKEALKILERCSHRLGFKASARIHGYLQVWARDSMITALGALVSGKKSLIDCVGRSIRTLISGQTEKGLIPNNVDVESEKENYQAYADGGLWLCIGTACAADHLGREFLESLYGKLGKVMEWYDYQDVHNEGLLSQEEGSDWMDLFASRGRVLYTNVLHAVALSSMGRISSMLGKEDEAFYARRAGEKILKVDKRFWYDGSGNAFPYVRASFGTEVYTEEGFDEQGNRVAYPEPEHLGDSPYYIPYFTFRHYGEYFDTLGNLLAVIAGVAGKGKARKILRYIEDNNLADPGPVKALHPPVKEGEKDWRSYYTFGELNLPDQYHNGGIWPFIGGFYVAALVKAGLLEEAREQLEKLAELNRKGTGEREWEFHEWFHGVTGKPQGMAEQAWSAGMYLFAYEAVEKEELPLLGLLRE